MPDDWYDIADLEHFGVSIRLDVFESFAHHSRTFQRVTFVIVVFEKIQIIMSSPRTHLIQSVTSSALLYPVIGAQAVTFGLSVIFIDLDHIVKYILDTKSYSAKGFFLYYKLLEQNLDMEIYVLNLFHTVECWLILLFLGNVYPTCHYILLGFLFHYSFDICGLIKKGKAFVRAFSLFEYFIKKRDSRYLTNIRELLEEESVNMEGVGTLEEMSFMWHIPVTKTN